MEREVSFLFSLRLGKVRPAPHSHSPKNNHPGNQSWKPSVRRIGGGRGEGRRKRRGKEEDGTEEIGRWN